MTVNVSTIYVDTIWLLLLDGVRIKLVTNYSNLTNALAPWNDKMGKEIDWINSKKMLGLGLYL